MWPLVTEPDKICLDVHADIPSSKENVKFIKELPCNAIIRKYLSDGREFITCNICKTPQNLISKYIPNAHKTLELSVRLRFGNHQSTTWVFGTFEQVEQKLTLWLDSAPDTKKETQERGDLARGYYFTKETFIFIEPFRHRDYDVIIIPISRAALSNVVANELKKLRTLLGGEE
jgi:hypothetical protein